MNTNQDWSGGEETKHFISSATGIEVVQEGTFEVFSGQKSWKGSYVHADWLERKVQKRKKKEKRQIKNVGPTMIF